MEKITPRLPGFPPHMTIAKRDLHKQIIGWLKVVHRDRDGKILYENAAALINAGEEHMLKSWFQAVANSTPSGFKVNLAQDAAIAEDATSFTVVTGTGYAEVSVARNASDWTYSVVGGEGTVTSKDCLFQATGADWDEAGMGVLEAILNSVDTLVAYADLSEPRVVGNGESLTASFAITLS
jgi:hypothetical protein